MLRMTAMEVCFFLPATASLPTGKNVVTALAGINFYLLPSDKTGSGDHRAFYPMGT
jgi:hypothetical protein